MSGSGAFASPLVVHCHVPITVRVHGEPSRAALEALGVRVQEAVRGRLARAQVVLADLADAAEPRTANGPAALRDPASEQHASEQHASEQYDDEREGFDGYAVPSYRERGHRVPVPLTRPTSGRGWLVLRAVHFRSRVDEFLDVIEEVNSGDPSPSGGEIPGRALYADLAADERAVAVWLVETDVTTTAGALLPQLSARALELSRAGSGHVMAAALTYLDGDVGALAALDASGQVAALPVLSQRNARRARGQGASAEFLHGARLVWAGMVLPDITPDTLLDIGPVTTLTMPLAEAEFSVDAAGFQARQGIAWQALLDEAGSSPTRVDALPVRTRRRVSEEALDFAARLAFEAAAFPPADAGVVLDHRVVYADEPGLPRAVADAVAAFPGAAAAPGPAGRPASVPEPSAPPGAGVAALAIHLPLDAETLGAARWRPMGRSLAQEMRGLLARDVSDVRWKYPVYEWFGTRLGDPPDSRPEGGSPWEYALIDLDRTGDLARLFDAVEDADWDTLTLRLLWHSRATRLATHPRVAALFARERQRWLDLRRSGYVASAAGVAASVVLDRDESTRLTAGAPGRNVLGDLSSTFIIERSAKALTPAAAGRFRTALEADRLQLIGALATGADPRELSPEQMLREVVGTAAEHAHITEDDFVTHTIERSVRLVDVRFEPHHDLPMWVVTLQRVERAAGTREWTPIGATFDQSADEFEAGIIYWRLGKSGQFYEAVGIAISVVGLVAVAWEAGIVAALVAAGGGAKVVIASIAISELIYVVRVVFFDADLSVEGFVMAGVEGYLGALGFRAGVLVGETLAARIGAGSVQRVWTGIVVEKLAVGVVGGASTGALTQFAHDVVAVAIHDGQASGWRAYVGAMTIGAAMGVLGEFTVAPVLRAAGSGGRAALTSAADLVGQLRAEGFTAAQFGAAASEALSALRVSATSFALEASANGLVGAFAARAEQVLGAWGASVTARRVLELSGAQFSRQATVGLTRFLEAADQPASAEAARRLAAQFADHSQEVVHLLEVLAELDAAAATRLMRGTFAADADLAAFLGRIAQYTPEQQRGILILLADAELVALPAGAGSTAQQVVERQLAAALRLQAEAAHQAAAQLRLQADAKFEQALVADVVGLRRRVDSLLAEAARIEARAVAAEREADRLAGPPASDATTGGAAQRHGDLPVDLPGDNAAALADELDAALAALEAGTGPQQSGTWIQLPAQRHPTPEQARALARLVFTSRSGNPVVFRIEGGTGGVENRSREYIRVDAAGRVRIAAADNALNINVGVFERAVEFILTARPGAQLKLFEVDAGYLRSLQSITTPEQGARTLLHPTDAAGDLVPGAAVQTPGRISDVKNAVRRVDTRQAVDQLQLSPSIAAELNDFVVPGTGRVLEFVSRGRTGRPAP